jgi:hypothetical protein
MIINNSDNNDSKSDNNDNKSDYFIMTLFHNDQWSKNSYYWYNL